MQQSISHYPSVDSGKWDNLPTTQTQVPTTDTPKHALNFVEAHLRALGVRSPMVEVSPIDERNYWVVSSEPRALAEYLNMYSAFFHAFEVVDVPQTVELVRKNRAMQNWAGAK